ncbi:MAG: Uma2 family endonuclease [Ignavibacteriae bacterium]|nr:Uma2 family endonuclease [Ignavibacteriota bacterium]
MSTAPKRYITPEEYLEIERNAKFKSEYFNGEMFAMAGGSRIHGLIATNVIGELRNQLRGRPCMVYNSDVRVHIAATGLYAYPDVSVVCGETTAEQETDVVTNPLVIVEVLSASTKDYDRGQKFEQYRKLISLREYLLISQHEPHVEQYIRQEGAEWLFRERYDPNDVVTIAALDCTLPLREIYDKVTFPTQQ